MRDRMLEKYDLKQKIAKKQYDEISAQLEIKLGSLQRQARALNIPIIIVFEGWDAAGKGTLINKLLLTMDARGYNVYPTNPPNREERLRPFLWRFWLNTPAKGRITIFDRSWCTYNFGGNCWNCFWIFNFRFSCNNCKLFRI